MERRDTHYGELLIGSPEDVFRTTVDILEGELRLSRLIRIGLTGGSTPKAFYTWVVENNAFSEAFLDRALWLCSDERMVPLEHEDSNFGNADRLMLTPLGVPDAHKLNWPVKVDPHSASVVFNRRWNDRFGAQQAFDVCMLGMGTDGHTASLFPNHPILAANIEDNFVCVEIPEKGWRLTITEAGMSRCGKILITVMGQEKAERVRTVFQDPPGTYPVQILANFADKVTWLVDDEAAEQIR